MHVMKYILFEDGVAVVFPTSIRHLDVARRSDLLIPAFRAGFVAFDGPNGCHTFGDSESLGLESVPGDAELIAEQYIGLGGLDVLL